MANGWHRLLRRAQRYEELPLAALQAIAEPRPQLAALEQAAIKVAREKGATWEEIATALGVTKENGSSWIFEARLTCANALRRVQHPAFALVTRQAAQMRFRTDDE